MTSILKLLLSATTTAACLYGVNVFGFSMWPIIFSALSFLIFVSLFFPKLNTAAVIIASTATIVKDNDRASTDFIDLRICHMLKKP